MKMLRSALWVSLMALLTGILFACGGGGGGGGSGSSSAPVISDLIVSPATAYASSSPMTFDGQFDFTDSDGNLASVTMKFLDGSGSVVHTETSPIQGDPTLKDGSIVGQVLADIATPDTYTVQVYVTDATGQTSNMLSATVRIAAFPWTSELAGPTAREYAAAAVLNGKIYVMGGQRTDSGVTPGPATNLVEIFDPATNTWSTGTPLTTARMGLVASVVNGRIYAIGGRTDGFSTSAVGTVEEFDPGTNLWTTRNPMPTPRFHAAAALVAGEIHVAGGEFETNVLSTVEAYNPLTNQWRNRTAMPTARGQLAMAESGGLLYAVGGYAGLIARWVGTVEAYNPLTDSWVARASMPNARAQLALGQVNGKLLAAGGENVSRALDVLESYDPVTNAWTLKTPSTSVFTRATAGVVGGKMHVFGNNLSFAYDPANELR